LPLGLGPDARLEAVSRGKIHVDVENLAGP
jgi:hypothetical protein